MGVAQDQVGGAEIVPPNGSGHLVVWNISGSSMGLVVLSAQLVLLDPAYNSLQIVFSAVVIGNQNWWAWPSVTALVVEPSLLIHREMKVLYCDPMNTSGAELVAILLFNPLASGWLNHQSGVLADSLSLLHFHYHCPQCEHGGGGRGGDGCGQMGLQPDQRPPRHPGVSGRGGRANGRGPTLALLGAPPLGLECDPELPS